MIDDFMCFADGVIETVINLFEPVNFGNEMLL